MADHQLRREVIVPASPAHRPQVLVALSVILVLLAGAVDSFLWKVSRERASPRPAVQAAPPGDDAARRLERLEQRHRFTPGAGDARSASGPATDRLPPEDWHPSQVIGSPPF